MVDVAAPIESVPFWLADRGFRETGLSLANPDARWKLYRRTFDRGPIGLGVNGLDRSPPAHYVVFVRPLEGREAADERSGRSSRWRTASGLVAEVVAGPGVSAAFDVSRPFAALPDELVGVGHAPAGPRRATLDAAGHGTGLEDACGLRSANRTRWRSSFGADPAGSWSGRGGRRRRSSRRPSGSSRRRRTGEPVRPSDASASWRATRPASRSRTCSTIRSSAATGSPWADSSPTRLYRYALGDGTPRGLGTLEDGEDRAGGRSCRCGSSTWAMPRRASRTGGGSSNGAFRRHPGIDFVVLAGDLVDRGNERTNWDHFFLRAAAVFDRVPVMPCVGNHEYLDVGPAALPGLLRAAAQRPARASTRTWSTRSRPATPASPCSTAPWPSGTPRPRVGRRNGSTDARRGRRPGGRS